MTDINLLPWRRMKRERAKKLFKLYLLACVFTTTVMAFSIHYYVSHKTQQSVLQVSADQDAFRKQLKQFKDQYRKTTAKIGQQSLDSLHFIGLLNDGSKTWALIGQPDGLVSTVLVGDYLGKEHGRVVDIHDDFIEIEKTVLSKRGLERSRVLLRLR